VTSSAGVVPSISAICFILTNPDKETQRPPLGPKTEFIAACIYSCATHKSVGYGSRSSSLGPQMWSSVMILLSRLARNCEVPSWLTIVELCHAHRRPLTRSSLSSLLTYRTSSKSHYCHIVWLWALDMRLPGCIMPAACHRCRCS
jgi:hypothetical protein